MNCFECQNELINLMDNKFEYLPFDFRLVFSLHWSVTLNLVMVALISRPGWPGWLGYVKVGHSCGK